MKPAHKTCCPGLHPGRRHPGRGRLHPHQSLLRALGRGSVGVRLGMVSRAEFALSIGYMAAAAKMLDEEMFVIWVLVGLSSLTGFCSQHEMLVRKDWL